MANNVPFHAFKEVYIGSVSFQSHDSFKAFCLSLLTLQPIQYTSGRNCSEKST